MIDSPATGVTHFTALKWWGLDVGVEASVVVDVSTVHPLHMQGTVLVWFNVLGCSVIFIIQLNYIYYNNITASVFNTYIKIFIRTMKLAYITRLCI